MRIGHVPALQPWRRDQLSRTNAARDGIIDSAGKATVILEWSGDTCTLAHTMYLSILRKSTPPQNRQHIVYYYQLNINSAVLRGS
jgi:hypothetical protein